MDRRDVQRNIRQVDVTPFPFPGIALWGKRIARLKEEEKQLGEYINDLYETGGEG